MPTSNRRRNKQRFNYKCKRLIEGSAKQKTREKTKTGRGSKGYSQEYDYLWPPGRNLALKLYWFRI